MNHLTLKWLTKIYVYLRTSGEVNPDHSIQTQKRLVDRYAKKHGLEIVEYLIDEKKTGLNQNREGFQKLLTLIEKDLVEVILVPYFDRIGRNDFEVSLFLMKLKKREIECISVGEQKFLSMMGEQEIVQACRLLLMRM